MSSIRIQKVADLIRDEISAHLSEEVEATRNALVTVTAVTLTSDMSLARVFVSIFPDTVDREAILASLQAGRGRLRRDLGRALRLRRIPALEFRLDTSAERGDRIERLLRSENPGGGRSSGEDG